MHVGSHLVDWPIGLDLEDSEKSGASGDEDISLLLEMASQLTDSGTLDVFGALVEALEKTGAMSSEAARRVAKFGPTAVENGVVQNITKD